THRLRTISCLQRLTPPKPGLEMDGSVEPDQGFRWITDEPFDYTNWGQFDPGNNSGDLQNPNEQYVTLVSSGFWNDLAGPPVTTSGYYVEFVGVLEPSCLAVAAAMLGLVACRRLRSSGRQVATVLGVVALLGLVTMIGEAQAQVTGTGTITGTFSDDIETTSGAVVLEDELPAGFNISSLSQIDSSSVLPLVEFPDNIPNFPVSEGSGSSTYGFGLDGGTLAFPSTEGRTNAAPTRTFLNGEAIVLEDLFNTAVNEDSPGGTLRREYDPALNSLAFSSGGFVEQPQGETFVAGLLEFTNGDTFRGTEVPSVTLTLETMSDEPAFVQTLEVQIGIVTTFSRFGVLNTPENQADFIYFPAQPELGSFRVFEGETATVEVLAEFNSLELSGFGEVSDPSVSFVSPSIGEIPEPASVSLIAMGLAVSGRRRHS
ncbi:MAG: choice-of-anchor K domain-containing protein, partial [Planctomycetota bacterium]